MIKENSFCSLIDEVIKDVFCKIYSQPFSTAVIVIKKEDRYMKELLNVLCGHIVAAVFSRTKTAARFQPPCFAEGCYLPEGEDPDGVIHICYMNDYAESAMLLHDQFPRSANEM